MNDEMIKAFEDCLDTNLAKEKNADGSYKSAVVDWLFQGYLVGWYSRQSNFDQLQTKSDKAVSALEAYVRAHNENNLSLTEMRIAQETLLEIKEIKI